MEITIPPPHSQQRKKLNASLHAPRTAHLYKTPQKRRACFVLHLSGNNWPIIHQVPYNHCNILLSNLCSFSFQESVNRFKITAQWLLWGHCPLQKSKSPFSELWHTQTCFSFFSGHSDTVTNVQERQQWAQQQQQQSYFNSVKGLMFLPCNILCTHILCTPKDTGGVETTHWDNCHTTEANQISSPPQAK